MARAMVKAKARAKSSAKAAENFEPGLATAEVFEPSPPPEENLEPAEAGAPASMPDQLIGGARSHRLQFKVGHYKSIVNFKV